MAKKVELQLFEGSKTRKVKSNGEYSEDPFTKNSKKTTEKNAEKKYEKVVGKVVKNIQPKLSKNSKFVKTVESKTGRIDENKYLR